MNFKKIAVILSLSLLAASCNPFSPATTGGLVKSLNAGDDWQFINRVKDQANLTLAGLSISSLAYDPSKKDKVYAGSYNSGLYMSEDAGNTWTQILSKISVYDFVINPGDPNLIYVAGVYNDHGKVLVTHDGGKSWEEIFNEASSQNPVRAIALNPQDPSQVIAGLSSGTVVKSSDGGKSWKLVGNHNDRINKIRWQPGAVYILFRGKGLFKSTDNGENFVDNNFGLKNSTGFYQAAVSAFSASTFNQFVVSPFNPNVIYVTASNALYKSVDSGSTWQKLPLPVNQDQTVVRAIALAPSDENIVYTSAGSTIYRSTDGGLQWKAHSVATTGFVNALMVDPGLPQISYAGIYLQK